MEWICNSMISLRGPWHKYRASDISKLSISYEPQSSKWHLGNFEISREVFMSNMFSERGELLLHLVASLSLARVEKVPFSQEQVFVLSIVVLFSSFSLSCWISFGQLVSKSKHAASVAMEMKYLQATVRMVGEDLSI